jgi:hypothetical protein
VYIGGLSAPFNDSNYIEAFLGSKNATNGSYNYTGIVYGYTTAPSSGTKKNVEVEMDLYDFSYGVNIQTYANTVTASGQYYRVQSSPVAFKRPRGATASPGRFSVTADVMDTYVNLSWTSSSQVYYYDIYVDDSWFLTTTGNSTTIDGFEPNTQYTIEVIAINSYGERKVTRTITTLPLLPDSPYFNSMSLENLNSIRVYFEKAYNTIYTEFYWTTDVNDTPVYGSSYKARTTNSSQILLENLPYYSPIYVYIRSRNSVGTVSPWSYCDSLETGQAPPPTAPSITSRFDGGLNMSWGSITGASQYTFEYKPSYLTTWTAITTPNTYCTISGLSYAVKYDFRVKSDLNPTYSTVSSGHTLPKKPTISATNITHSSVTIKVNALPDNCDKVKIESYIYSNGNYVYDSMQFIDPPGRTFPTAQTATFTGLYRGLSYRFFAYSAYDANGDGTGTGTWLESEQSNIVTVSTLNRPDNWDWVTNFYSGMEFTVYNIGTANYYYYIMPAAEWNSFLAKINEFRAYKNLSTVNFPTYTRDADFTAAVYNLAVNAINAMSAYFVGYTAIPTKSSGSELTATDFTRLRNTLNSIS